MASGAWVQKRRDINASLRKARREQRTMDSALERVERELLRLRSRKTMILPDEVVKIASLWDAFRGTVTGAERALSDFLGAVNY